MSRGVGTLDPSAVVQENGFVAVRLHRPVAQRRRLPHGTDRTPGRRGPPLERTARVLTPPLDNIDIVNSHRNLATDGVSTFWEDVSSIKKMPIGGGPITVLDLTDANTPTAGVYLNRGKIVYASVNAVRFVPTGGATTSPLVRTIARADTTVTTILPVANGGYWGERSGAVRLKIGSRTHRLQEEIGKVPTSMGTNGYTSGGALTWTQCASSTGQCTSTPRR